jgi:high-affinity iron transporter
VIAALLLTFREGLEATLILGIALGILRRAGRLDQTRTVWLGAGLAGLVSLAAGLGLQALGITFEGTGEAIFEGITMILAAGVLTWMIFWMARQGRAAQTGLENDVRQAIAHGGIGSGRAWSKRQQLGAMRS